jgi:hypothetical protein
MDYSFCPSNIQSTSFVYTGVKLHDLSLPTL